MTYSSIAEWDRVRLTLDASYVVQPWLVGAEFRATVCASGVFAVARLVERRRGRSMWKDATTRFPRHVLANLNGITVGLGLPAIGFDIIRAGGKYHVLDVNVGPALAIHTHTERPRDLSDAYLDSWLSTPRTSRRQAHRIDS
jgi:hypothetical protein